LLDYHLPERAGLSGLPPDKRTIAPPCALLFSVYADASLAIPALPAGADGLVHRGAPAGELYVGPRLVVRGERVLPPPSRELLQAAGARLAPENLPILGMAIEETSRAEIRRCSASRRPRSRRGSSA
jgi:DNA-binding NarL/FixJ family response regulator